MLGALDLARVAARLHARFEFLDDLRDEVLGAEALGRDLRFRELEAMTAPEASQVLDGLELAVGPALRLRRAARGRDEVGLFRLEEELLLERATQPVWKSTSEQASRRWRGGRRDDSARSNAP